MAVAVVRGEGRQCERGRAGTGPGPGRRSVQGAGKRAETSRRSARDRGAGIGAETWLQLDAWAGSGAETWLQLNARFLGLELGCSPATAQCIAPGAGRGAETWLQFTLWLTRPGGRLRPGHCSVRGSESELRPDHSLVCGPRVPGDGLRPHRNLVRDPQGPEVG